MLDTKKEITPGSAIHSFVSCLSPYVDVYIFVVFAHFCCIVNPHLSTDLGRICYAVTKLNANFTTREPTPSFGIVNVVETGTDSSLQIRATMFQLIMLRDCAPNL